MRDFALANLLDIPQEPRIGQQIWKIGNKMENICWIFQSLYSKIETISMSFCEVVMHKILTILAQ